jgi:hypothetical protein
MNRVLRPGVCLIFLVTGMSATLFAESRNAGQSSGFAATGTHLKFITAAILLHGVTADSAIRAESPATPQMAIAAPSAASPAFPRACTLGAAKLPHFGRLSARKV